LLDGEGLDTRAGETGNGGVAARVIAAGPNAFVYFTDTADPLLADEIERRYPQLLSRLSAHTGVGFLLVRSASGPVCWWRGRPVPPDGSDGGGPFAARPDRAVVLDGLRDLMAMPSAGDIVLYGTGAPGGDVSFIAERGAHAGPSELELQTFILHPASVSLPADPITHPVQLYPHFAAYADPLTPAPDSARKPVPLAADS
jgi:hypothetical protein